MGGERKEKKRKGHGCMQFSGWWPLWTLERTVEGGPLSGVEARGKAPDFRLGVGSSGVHAFT